ncbi:MAG: 30S ribosomal protein S4 [Chloroflexi bacterium]|nr:30S ribosomal protein S4 [Chloroflexota bacterium]
MARYTGPVCRLCRRAGEKLFLKGERCFTAKCAIEKRRRAPGATAQARSRRLSDYGVQLKEKRKARVIYGVLERQFRRYYQVARKNPQATGLVLMQHLERRMDNVVYRLDFAESRSQGRQMVMHGHFTVNDRRMDIPSYQVNEGDVISWKPTSQDSRFVKALVLAMPRKPVPGWLSLDAANLKGAVVRIPGADDLDRNIEPRLIVEFYSK